MIYRCCQPSAHLKEFIKDYLLIHLDFTQTNHVPVKPYPACPKQGIIFYIRGTVFSSNPVNGAAEKRASTVIFGQPVTRQDLLLPKDYLAISVRFQPGGLFTLLGIPMTEFLQKNIDAELVFGQEIRMLNDRLAHTPAYADMLRLIEEFVWKKIQQQKQRMHHINKIGQLIYENPQTFSLEKFASKACLSTRQLERQFIQHIGITPKYYARICRFYQVYLLKLQNPSLPWIEIAWERGYNDYQHLVKDFKEFSGGTPNKLIQEDSASPEQYLSLNPRFKYN